MRHNVFQRLTIIGLGLIGSSIARAAKEDHLAATIVGCDANEVSLAYAKKEGCIDVASHDAAHAVQNSDAVILATPPASLEAVISQIAPNLAQGAIVMDVASVKIPAIMAIAPHIPDSVIFVPTHPIAGSEQSGVRAGKADLFHKKRIIITPESPPDTELMQLITKFWEGMGARVEAMPPEVHDMLYGYMSHLPQAIAFALKSSLGEFYDTAKNNAVYQSFLRISRSPTPMWAEIFALNHENLLQGLDRYMDVVAHVIKELASAPEGEESKEEPLLAHTVLFPRIVASCLVTTVMEAEKMAGFNFSRYAGTGFADLSAPAVSAPEQDIERISAQYRLVAVVLKKFLERLQEIRTIISGANATMIELALRN
jgi:cyclohexadieny/prephenate dehydrogenase